MNCLLGKLISVYFHWIAAKEKGTSGGVTWGSRVPIMHHPTSYISAWKVNFKARVLTGPVPLGGLNRKGTDRNFQDCLVVVSTSIRQERQDKQGRVEILKLASHMWSVQHLSGAMC